jgi:hypothetical protein
MQFYCTSQHTCSNILPLKNDQLHAGLSREHLISLHGLYQSQFKKKRRCNEIMSDI